MTPGGWLVMGICVGGVTVFFAWTLLLALTRESDDSHLHSTRDEPPDVHSD